MTINNREFHVFIHHSDIHDQIIRMAGEVNRDYKSKNPLFLVILNGAFMFAADLVRELQIPSEITFIRLRSYDQMKSTGKVRSLMGLTESLKGRHVVILEDIVDTGCTLSYVLQSFKNSGALSMEIATLLFKELSVKRDFMPKYIGFRIPDRFVVGYGLDYNGFGRNLKDIYQIA